jgi:hypothetical protein
MDIKKLLAVEKSFGSLSSVPDNSGSELAPFSEKFGAVAGLLRAVPSTALDESAAIQL